MKWVEDVYGNFINTDYIVAIKAEEDKNDRDCFNIFLRTERYDYLYKRSVTEVQKQKHMQTIMKFMKSQNEVLDQNFS